MKHLITLILMLVISHWALAETKTVKYGDLWYEIDTNSLTATVTYNEGVEFEIDSTIGVTSYKVSKGAQYSYEKITVPTEIIVETKSYKVKTVGNKAFASCKSLISIELSNGIETIDINAFNNCENLKHIIFPSTLKTINGGSFARLRNIPYIVLPEGLQEIGYVAFASTYPKVFFIPSSVTSAIYIPSGSSLNPLNLVCLSKNLLELPVKPFDTFYGNNAKVYVPAELVNDFKNATYWKDFKSIEPYVKIDSFSIQDNLSNLGVGKIMQLNTSVTPENASLKMFSWKSSNPEVATVDDNGLITGISKGTATITAESVDGQFLRQNYTINVEDNSGFLHTDETSININATKNLSVDLTPYFVDKYTGFQFDITLPTGISMENMELNESLKQSGFEFSWKKVDDQTSRFIAHSNTLAEVNVTEDLVTFTIKATPSAVPGKQQIKFSNAMVSLKDASEIFLADSETAITVNKPVTAINLPEDVIYIETGKYKTITFTYDPADASDAEFEIELDCQDYEVNRSIEGNQITLHGDIFYGETNLTVKSKYDPSVFAQAKIIFYPRLEIGYKKQIVKETEIQKLYSYFYPDAYPMQGAKELELVWSTSDESLATIDNNGKMTALKSGTVTISVQDKNNELTKGSVEFTIEPRLLGDATDNGYVNVSDVVAIANYVADYTINGFSIINANVDDTPYDDVYEYKNVITTSDISGTVNIILNDDDYVVGPRNVRAYALDSSDYLFADNFMPVGNDEELTLEVNLENAKDYVALQALVIVPEGMKVTDVKMGPRGQNHALISNIKDDNTVKIVIYSLNNSSFAIGNEPLFTIKAIAEKECGNIEIINILATDEDCNEYSLNFKGGLNEGTTTDITNIATDNEDVHYFSIDGLEINNPVPGQLVIRKQGNKVEKVIVK